MSLNRITQDLIDQGESPSVEMIDSVANEDQIAKAVLAFLNTKGGTVIVGLNEDMQLVKKLTNQHIKKLEKQLRKSITPRILFAISLDESNHGNVIVIEVPKGRDRPYLLNGTIFVRYGSRVKAATPDQVRKMVEEDTDRPRWERKIATGLRVEDLDAKLIKQTAKSAVENRGVVFSDIRDHSTVLNELSMNQFGQLTNAADVAFGERVSGRHPQTRVRAVRYETDRGGDRFIDDQLLEGPALKVYEDAMAFFRRHVSVENSFMPGQMKRQSKPEYPFNSLREGLINALAHRDYASFSGSASLSIYPNRIEIWNFGELAAGVTTKKLEQAKHDSVLVNPDIANVFYLNQLMERIGRGTFNIVRECGEFGMPAPKWEKTSSGIKLTLFAATELGKKAVLSDLNPRQRELLRIFRPGDGVTVKEITEHFDGEDLSVRQARRDISELVEIGAFEQIGLGRATVYERTESF